MIPATETIAANMIFSLFFTLSLRERKQHRSNLKIEVQLFDSVFDKIWHLVVKTDIF